MATLTRLKQRSHRRAASLRPRGRGGGDSDEIETDNRDKPSGVQELRGRGGGDSDEIETFQHEKRRILSKEWKRWWRL